MIPRIRFDELITIPDWAGALQDILAAAADSSPKALIRRTFLPAIAGHRRGIHPPPRPKNPILGDNSSLAHRANALP